MTSRADLERRASPGQLPRWIAVVVGLPLGMLVAVATLVLMVVAIDRGWNPSTAVALAVLLVVPSLVAAPLCLPARTRRLGRWATGSAAVSALLLAGLSALTIELLESVAQ